MCVCVRSVLCVRRKSVVLSPRLTVAIGPAMTSIAVAVSTWWIQRCNVCIKCYFICISESLCEAARAHVCLIEVRLCARWNARCTGLVWCVVSSVTQVLPCLLIVPVVATLLAAWVKCWNGLCVDRWLTVFQPVDVHNAREGEKKQRHKRTQVNR